MAMTNVNFKRSKRASNRLLEDFDIWILVFIMQLFVGILEVPLEKVLLYLPTVGFANKVPHCSSSRSLNPILRLANQFSELYGHDQCKLRMLKACILSSLNTLIFK